MFESKSGQQVPSDFKAHESLDNVQTKLMVIRQRLDRETSTYVRSVQSKSEMAADSKTNLHGSTNAETEMVCVVT